VSGPVEAAVERELNGLPEARRNSALAASARHLARVVDLTTSARDVAAIARELRAHLAELSNDTTGGEEVDELDALRRRRNPGPAGEVGT
jgi:hypothetical protein